MRGREPLFCRFDLHDAVDNHGRKLREHMEALPSNVVLGKSPDQLVDEVVREYHLAAPVLKVEDISVEQQDAKVDVSRDYNRHIFDRSQPFYLSGTRVTFFVPFEGDAELFGARPSTYSSTFPFADVKGSELVFSYDQLDHDAAAVRGKFDHDLAQVSPYLDRTGFLKAHPNFRRSAKHESGSSAGRYVLHHPSDADRELVVTILVYDVPV